MADLGGIGKGPATGNYTGVAPAQGSPSVLDVNTAAYTARSGTEELTGTPSERTLVFPP